MVLVIPLGEIARSAIPDKPYGKDFPDRFHLAGGSRLVRSARAGSQEKAAPRRVEGFASVRVVVKDRNGVRVGVRHRKVNLTIAVEVGGDDEMRGGSDLKLDRFSKRPIAHAEKDQDAVRAAAGDCNVQHAVAVEISRGHGVWHDPGLIDIEVAKCAIAIAGPE